IDPQKLAQRGGIPSIGLAALPLLRLDENHLVAAVLVQQANQPVVKSTNLEHGDERFVRVQPLAGELLRRLRYRGVVCTTRWLRDDERVKDAARHAAWRCDARTTSHWDTRPQSWPRSRGGILPRRTSQEGNVETPTRSGFAGRPDARRAEPLSGK